MTFGPTPFLEILPDKWPGCDDRPAFHSQFSHLRERIQNRNG